MTAPGAVEYEPNVTLSKQQSFMRDTRMVDKHRYRPRNVNAHLNNPAFLSEIVSLTGRQLGRPIGIPERMEIKKILQDLDAKRFQGKSFAEIEIDIVGIIVNTIKIHGQTRCDYEDEYDWNATDMHNYQKRKLGKTAAASSSGSSTEVTTVVGVPTVDISSIGGFKDVKGFRYIMAPASVYQYKHIMLDSKNRDLTDDGLLSISWGVSVDSPSVTQGFVNIIGAFGNIISMITGKVRIPYVPTAVNNHNRASLFVEEFTSDAYIGTDNRKFHFWYESRVDGTSVDLSPEEFGDFGDRGNRASYIFNGAPKGAVSTITVSFGSPTRVIQFQKDRLNCTVTATNPAVITTTEAHNITTGEYVTVSAFTTDAPLNDGSAINAVNYTINRVTWQSATQLQLDGVDATDIKNNISGSMSMTNGSVNVTGVGTLFTSELAVTTPILIQDSVGVRRYYTVASITNDFTMTLNAVYAGPTESFVYAQIAYAGTVTTAASATVVGAATTFLTDFRAGDFIEIRDGAAAIIRQEIQSVETNTSLTLTAAFTGVVGAGQQYFKNNDKAGHVSSVYFESRRIYIPLTFVYFE